MDEHQTPHKILYERSRRLRDLTGHTYQFRYFYIKTYYKLGNKAQRIGEKV